MPTSHKHGVVDRALVVLLTTAALSLGSPSWAAPGTAPVAAPTAIGPDEAALRNAAGNGDLGAVRSLLAKGAHVNAEDSLGNTALIDAAENGHLDVVRTLLTHGAPVDEPDGSGDTALVTAVEEDH